MSTPSGFEWRDYIDFALAQIERRFQERDATIYSNIEATKESSKLTLAHIEHRFEAQEKSLASALSSSDRAVSKAEAATERRLAGMNEFRDALNDYSRTLLPRTEFEATYREIKEKMDIQNARIVDRDVMPRIEAEKMHSETKERIEQLSSRFLSRDFMPRTESEKMHQDSKEKIEALLIRVNAIDARRTGRGELWGYLVGAIGAVITVVTVMNKLFAS